MGAGSGEWGVGCEVWGVGSGEWVGEGWVFSDCARKLLESCLLECQTVVIKLPNIQKVAN